jgi:hypothetical protein
MSIIVSLPVIALDQVVRTSTASFAAQPVIQVQHWITDSAMAVPFFVIGVWAGDLVANWARIGTAKRSDLLFRSFITALLCGVALAPVWFVINKVDNPVKAQPLVFPQAHDSGDVYSVSPAVVVALVCVCLGPAAFLAGRAVARAASRSVPAIMPAAVTRVLIPALLTAAVPVLAWLMYQVAGHAYASQVYYPRAPVSALHRLRHPAAASPVSTALRVTPAPDAVVSQAAHALQDGLAGQAAGIPVTAVTAGALLRAKTKTAKTKTGKTINTATTSKPRGNDAAPASPARPANTS